MRDHGAEGASASARIGSPEIDVIVVTVKALHHFAIVREAVAVGKLLCCEWPLADGPDEARELKRWVQDAGIVAVPGTQARVAPESSTCATVPGETGQARRSRTGKRSPIPLSPKPHAA